jgi:hypothetical protein
MSNLGHPLYATWVNMRQRCNNPVNNRYRFYGERGITVCDRWANFNLFIEDMGERPEGYSLDRIDTYGNYEPSNCRWASLETQIENRRPRTNPPRVFNNSNPMRNIQVTRNGRFQVQMFVNGKRIYMNFLTLAEAQDHRANLEMEITMHQILAP